MSLICFDLAPYRSSWVQCPSADLHRTSPGAGRTGPVLPRISFPHNQSEGEKSPECEASEEPDGPPDAFLLIWLPISKLGAQRHVGSAEYDKAGKRGLRWESITTPVSGGCGFPRDVRVSA